MWQQGVEWTLVAIWVVFPNGLYLVVARRYFRGQITSSRRITGIWLASAALMEALACALAFDTVEHFALLPTSLGTSAAIVLATAVVAMGGLIALVGLTFHR